MVFGADGALYKSVEYTGEAIRALKDAHMRVERNESETQVQLAKEQIEKLKLHENTEILNLTYRQGPDLPALRQAIEIDPGYADAYGDRFADGIRNPCAHWDGDPNGLANDFALPVRAYHAADRCAARVPAGSA